MADTTAIYHNALALPVDVVEAYTTHNTPGNFDAMMSQLEGAKQILKETAQ